MRDCNLGHIHTPALIILSRHKSTLPHTIKNNNESPYRMAKTHRMPYHFRSVSTKEPYNWWRFGGK